VDQISLRCSYVEINYSI